MFVLFDELLAVDHDPVGRDFQEEMLAYMPAPHRAMARAFAAKWRADGARSVRELARARAAAGDGALADAYDEAVSALRDLRRFHLATVARYLERTSTGTGASAWRTLLQANLDSTARAAVGCPFATAGGKQHAA